MVDGLKRWGFAAGLCCAGLVGCGDDEGQAAGGAGGDGGAGTSPLIWETCHDAFECTTVQVPLDYEDPDGATVQLGVLRARARGERLGVMFVNQGGPGLPTVSWLAQIYPAAKVVLPDIGEHFDIIAFDWRGVGTSAPIRCDFTAADIAFRALPIHAEASEALQGQLEQVFASYQTSCSDDLGGALLASMSTENAARDMDLIRAALGEDQINYLGFSYGAYLGAVYLTLYPERARAFVLDSPPSPTPDLLAETSEWAIQVERAYLDFFAWCGEDSACAFHGGEGESAVEAAFTALMSQLDAASLQVGERALTRSDAGKAIFVRLTDGSFEAVAQDLAAAEGGDGAPLLAQADAWYEPLEGADSRTIYCLDRGDAIDAAELWAAVGALEQGSAPHAAHDLSNWWGSCRDWPNKAAPVTISAGSAPAALIVAGPRDPWTPIEYAEATQEALANGSHLLIGDSDRHVQTDKSRCVSDAVNAFIMDPTTTPASDACGE